MDEHGSVAKQLGSKSNPLRPDNFKLTISREGWVGITFESDERELVTVLLQPDLANAVSEYLAPDKRQELWELAKQHLDEGLN